MSKQSWVGAKPADGDLRIPAKRRLQYTRGSGSLGLRDMEIGHNERHRTEKPLARLLLLDGLTFAALKLRLRALVAEEATDDQ